jgi:thiol-disulfide isomerase/thioredoxin
MKDIKMIAALSSIPVIGLSCVPGTNIFTGFIKIFVYLTKESELVRDIKRHTLLTNRRSVDSAGQRVAKVAQSLLDQIEKDVSSLKWYSLLQMIPLIGIIGVIFEQRALANINQILENSNQLVPPEIQPNNIDQEIPIVPKRKSSLEGKKIIELTDANYQDIIGPDSKGTVVVLFTADWCSAAKKITPIFEELIKNKSDNITFARANRGDNSSSDKNPNLSEYAMIRKVPTFIVYKNGKNIKELNGSNEDDLRAFFNAT